MTTRSFTIPDFKDDRGRVPHDARVRATRADTHAFVEEALIDEYGNATFSSLPVDVDVSFHATWGGTTTGLKERWFYSHINAVSEGGTGSSDAATARTNLGIGTEDSPQIKEINLGHASDTTIARESAGKVSVEGIVIVRPANYVVAANNAPTHVKAQADYTCDGTDDHVEIQAAIDALPATGGKVLLTEGTFNTATTLALDSYQTLQGMGRSTILTAAGYIVVITAQGGGVGSEKEGILISDLQVDGASTGDLGIYFNYIADSTIQNVYVKDFIFDVAGNGSGIMLLDSISIKAINCICENNEVYGILLAGVVETAVTLNICRSNGVGIAVIYSPIVDPPKTLTISNNICDGNTYTGISVIGVDNLFLMNNFCHDNGTHGIFLNGSDHNYIIGNHCTENSQTATNTSDDIQLTNSDYNFIQANICRAGGETNKPRYGINIGAATCDDNKVINNDLYDDGFGTAPYNDSGTDTIYLEPEDTRDFLKYFGNRTLFSGGTISAHGAADGSVAVASCTAWCKETDADSADGVFFSYAGKAKQTLTDQQVNFIYLDYNADTPQIVVDTALLTYSLKLDHILLGAVFRDDTTVHIHNVDHIGIGGISRSNLHWTEHFMVHRVSGAVTSSTGTRQLVVTAGVVYAGLTRNATNAFNTNNGDTFTYWYSTDGGTTWVKVEPASTAIDNVQFNDMSDPYGLDDLGEAKYGVHWVYLDNDGIHLHVVYGQDSYNANQAEEAGIPVNLPSLVTNYCVLIAKIIVQKSQPTLVITYPWTTVFTSSLATDHGSLGGLADDDHSQYLLLAGETTDAQLHSGADLIVYSDAGSTEKARIDGATGNITTSGTVDGVDIAGHATTKSANATLGHVIVEDASKVDVDGSGKLTLGSDVLLEADLEGSPTENESAKAPTSEWAFDHAALTTAHGATGANVGTTNEQTLTNKTLIATTNVVEEISTVASDATPNPTGGSLRNFYTITALAAAAEFAAPSGTPANANKLIIRIKDNATARALTWNAIYRRMEFALPTTTVISKTMYLGFIFNSADTKWDMVAINTEA